MPAAPDTVQFPVRVAAAAVFAAVLAVGAAVAILSMASGPEPSAGSAGIALPPAEPAPAAPAAPAATGPAATGRAGVPQPAGPAALPAPQAGVDGGLVVSPFSRASFAGLLPLAPADPLPPAPDPALVENGPRGPLPRVAADGRRPRDAYARPFDTADNRARLVIVVLEIGLAQGPSEAAILRLPAPVVLAIDAYAVRPEEWARAARGAGHEIVASLAVKGVAADGGDLGPRALRPAAADGQDVARLEAAMGRLTGYVGMLLLGGAGIDAASALTPVLQALRTRGLLLVDGLAGGGAPLFQMAEPLDLARGRIDVMIADAEGNAVDRQLAALEATARERFVAVAAIRPTPIGLERLRAWIARLDDSRFVLAPISAVAATRTARP